ncbi:hypothetical protein ADM90_16830 [Lysinibacillus macroides]|uniref:Uncharacterized protein n=1 Tax=Lysinibacillus macroides TaxID=33935 RepID=A0A0M9DHQ8_9BACI|nr:hypothetical protein ADM90_16830 [Lysinibacillus macroides]
MKLVNDIVLNLFYYLGWLKKNESVYDKHKQKGYVLQELMVNIKTDRLNIVLMQKGLIKLFTITSVD